MGYSLFGYNRLIYTPTRLLTLAVTHTVKNPKEP